MAKINTLLLFTILFVVSHCMPLDNERALHQEKKILEFLERLILKKYDKTSNAGTSQVVEVTDPEDKKTIGECVAISGSTSENRNMKDVKACWPFSRELQCPAETTRDFSYNPYRHIGATLHLKDVINDLQCGRNMFSHENENENANENEKREMEERIMGGEESNAGRFPWMVSIGRAAHGLSCGGAVVDRLWVVSAAHCFDDEVSPCNYNLRVGSFNWGYDTEGYHRDIPAAKIVRHPDYDDTDNDNDISMIKLSEPVDLSPTGYVNSICLPEQDEEYDVGKSCVAAGWGTLKQDGPVPMTLREVAVPLLSHETCAHENMTENQFCAGYMAGGMDTCQGDSGGPVMCQRSDGRWYIQGVTSFGNGCGKENWPGVYTVVPHYVHWIRSVIDRYS